jgi:hypothetical protein
MSNRESCGWVRLGYVFGSTGERNNWSGRCFVAYGVDLDAVDASGDASGDFSDRAKARVDCQIASEHTRGRVNLLL